MEAGLVMEQANLAFEEAGAPIRMELDVATLLATTFHELRAGATTDGERLDRPSTAMSTAEAVAVATSSGLHAHWFGDASIRPDHVARHLSGAVLKDDPDYRARLAAYFNRFVRRRAADSTLWKAWFEARTWLG